MDHCTVLCRTARNKHGLISSFTLSVSLFCLFVQASFGPVRLAAPDSLHGSLIILAVTDEELTDEVPGACLDLVIRFLHCERFNC